jgi:hypothetical protein
MPIVLLIVIVPMNGKDAMATGLATERQ